MAVSPRPGDAINSPSRPCRITGIMAPPLSDWSRASNLRSLLYLEQFISNLGGAIAPSWSRRLSRLLSTRGQNLARTFVPFSGPPNDRYRMGWGRGAETGLGPSAPA